MPLIPLDLFAVLCAWCGSRTGFAPVVGSHGICSRCIEQHFGDDDSTRVEARKEG